jgi:hypothetical protein
VTDHSGAEAGRPWIDAPAAPHRRFMTASSAEGFASISFRTEDGPSVQLLIGSSVVKAH